MILYHLARAEGGAYETFIILTCRASLHIIVRCGGNHTKRPYTYMLRVCYHVQCASGQYAMRDVLRTKWTLNIGDIGPLYVLSRHPCVCVCARARVRVSRARSLSFPVQLLSSICLYLSVCVSV